MMSIHGKQIRRIIAILLLTLGLLSAAGVKVRVSSTEAVEGSEIVVKLIAEGNQIVFPEITDIGGFPVEMGGVSTKLESSYINGNFTSKRLKTLQFSFYPETDLTIPSFKVTIDGKTYQTEPVKIRVVKPSAVTATSVDGYTLRIKSSKKRVFVGEPFIVTVDFFEPRNSSVTKVEYTPPKFKAFFSQALGEEKLKRTASGTIHQLQYLVTAKRAGTLSIIPPKARVGIRNFGASSDPWGFFANDIQWHSVRAKGIAIEVEPVPTDVDMVGIFSIESRIDHNKVKPNAPVTYTIKISGEGLLDDLADPKFDIPGVTIYGDDAKSESRVVGEKVISSYERKYVFISDRDFTIPSLTFKSFDYRSQKRTRLTTKQYEIKVEGSAGTAAEHPKVVTAPTPSVEVQEKEAAQAVVNTASEENRSILEDSSYYAEKEHRKSSRTYPPLVCLLAFVLGVIATLLGSRSYRWLKQRKAGMTKRYYSPKEALKILYPHTNHNKKVEAMVRKLYELEQGNRSVSVDKEELAKLVEEVQKGQSDHKI